MVALTVSSRAGADWTVVIFMEMRSQERGLTMNGVQYADNASLYAIERCGSVHFVLSIKILDTSHKRYRHDFQQLSEILDRTAHMIVLDG